MSTRKKKEIETPTEDKTTESKVLLAMTFLDDDTAITPSVKQPIYKKIFDAFRDSDKKLVKIDVSLLPLDNNGKQRKVTTVYYGLENVRKASTDKDKFKVVVRTTDNLVYIKKV